MPSLWLGILQTLKMKTKLFLLLSATMLFYSSCSLILMKKAGFEIPKVIAKEKMLTIAEKNGLLRTHISYTKPASLNYIKALNLGFPCAFLFNKSGQLLYFKNVDNNGCIGGLPVILSQLNTTQHYDTSQKYQLKELYALMVDSNGNSISAGTDQSQYDFIFISTFSTFYQKGCKYNQDWETGIKENKSAKIKYYQFNLDVLDEWNYASVDSLIKQGYLDYKWYNIGVKFNKLN